MKTADRISEAEINAYVDGQLDIAGRIEVEEHLAQNPEVAARVMADLHLRDTLRLALPAKRGEAPEQTVAWARRLEKALAFRRANRTIQRLAASVAIFALGWSAHFGWNELRRPPNQDNLMAQAAQLSEALNVRLPRIPTGWYVLNARRAETPEGPGVQLTFQTPEFGRLSLVARNTGDVGFVLPTIEANNTSNIHWQLVSDRYDLTAPLGRKPLEFAALELYQTLY